MDAKVLKLLIRKKTVKNKTLTNKFGFVRCDLLHQCKYIAYETKDSGNDGFERSPYYEPTGYIYITDEGKKAFEDYNIEYIPKRNESIRNNITTIIAVLSLIISIFVLLQQLGIIKVIEHS